MNIVKIVIVAAILGGAYQYFMNSRSVDVNSMGGITVEEKNYRISYLPDRHFNGDVYMIFGAGRTKKTAIYLVTFGFLVYQLMM